MDAIRVKKRGRSSQGLCTVHGLVDYGRTLCGLNVVDLRLLERLQLETLPELDGCRSCMRAARILDGYMRQPEKRGLQVMLPPSLGRARSTGSLSHGLSVQRGRRLR